MPLLGAELIRNNYFVLIFSWPISSKIGRRVKDQLDDEVWNFIGLPVMGETLKNTVQKLDVLRTVNNSYTKITLLGFPSLEPKSKGIRKASRI